MMLGLTVVGEVLVIFNINSNWLKITQNKHDNQNCAGPANDSHNNILLNSLIKLKNPEFEL